MQEQVDTSRDYLDRFWNNIIDALPAVIGALLLLIISYFVAKVVAAVVRKLLNQAGLNRRLHSAQGGNYIERAVPNPSNFVSKIVFWVLFLLGVSMAVSALGIPILNDFLRGVYGYLPNILAALVIFLVASAIAAGISGLVIRTMGETGTGKVVATAAPVVVMSIAVFMILNQLKIAPEIVVITYAALLGGASLGMALAFGLGGREVAGNILSGIYAKGQAASAQARADLQTGVRNTKNEAKRKLNR